jgi:hypothetical protein
VRVYEQMLQLYLDEKCQKKLQYHKLEVLQTKTSYYPALKVRGPKAWYLLLIERLVRYASPLF